MSYFLPRSSGRDLEVTTKFFGPMKEVKAKSTKTKRERTNKLKSLWIDISVLSSIIGEK
jgi:hypothetical protein